MGEIKNFYVGNKKYLCFVDYILSREIENKNSVCIILDSKEDLEQIEYLFLEWRNILKKLKPEVEKVEIVLIGKQNLSFSDGDFYKIKNSYDDIINFVRLHQLIGGEKKFCVITNNEVPNLPLEVQFEPLTISLGKEIFYEELISKITNLGYTRVNYVEKIGEFSFRGEIFDIWPNTFENYRLPYRIVFDENKVAEIKIFDTATQKSIKPFDLKNSEQIFIYPVEIKIDYSNQRDLSKFFSKFDLVLKVENEMPESLEMSDYMPTVRYYSDVKKFISELEYFIKNGYNIVIGYNYEYEIHKLKEIFNLNTYNIIFVQTEILDGFYEKKRKFLFTTYSEIFTKFDYYYSRTHKTYSSVRLEGIWEIQPQDFVVHKDYGIGKFLGIEKISYGEHTSEFLNILYKDNAKLYVPITEFSKVEKYVSLTIKEPPLSSLDKVSWQRTTRKIKESLKHFILQLYKIYSSRKKFQGFKCLPDNEFEKQLEESFIYEETEDQKRAIDEVKKDLCKNVPMDRIVVGDVGFGKTEVAIRAALKVVMSGCQVILLCPTTILAEQHYRTFVDRLSSFAVNIGLLTRLQKKSEIESTIREINTGKIDIIIGTHILLNDKIQFPKLGLVIIDEEHKFGVKHKEKIRLKYRQSELSIEYTGEDLSDFYNNKLSDTKLHIPHILSLTATPIPRTLSIALQGIKDISVIETPPEGRLPIETFVIAYNDNIIFNAISKELHRGGQVYYVFNNISLIEHKTNFIKKYFPLARVEFIHSKLPSKKIEDIMLDFVENKIQILITTTIIESGLDMPNVNTIIVEDADKYGLAQLYQLRGRVGRREVKAYCYFVYRPEKLASNAKKRLAALTEFSSLGSGYKLALRDLEIRGAGELLGTKQHGVINEIGLSMYSNIVQEILEEINLEQGKVDISSRKNEPEIKLEINAYIPESYIYDSETRIIFYRKILGCATEKQLLDVREELYDRFGKPKKEDKEVIDNLFKLSKLKILLKVFSIKSISLDKEYGIVLEFYNEKDLESFCSYFSFAEIQQNGLAIIFNKKTTSIEEIIKTLSPVRVERTT